MSPCSRSFQHTGGVALKIDIAVFVDDGNMNKLVAERIASYTPEKREMIKKYNARKGWTIHQYVRLQIKSEKSHANCPPYE